MTTKNNYFLRCPNILVHFQSRLKVRRSVRPKHIAPVDKEGKSRNALIQKDYS